MTRPAILIASAFLFAGCLNPKTDDGKPVSFTDPDDGKFDMSQFLATRQGFLPVPVVITEPAVGYGAGLGMMFIHDKLVDENRKGPPSITVLGGAYTESDSWGGGIAHFGSWREDTLRYAGILGRGHGNLEFFGVGDGPGGTMGEKGLDFEIDGVFLRQQLIAKIGDTPLFLGLRYEFATTETNFDVGVPAIEQTDFDRADAGLAAVVQYDTRDSIFTPTTGVNATAVAYHYDDWLGGDAEYNRLELRSPFWVPVNETLFFGLNSELVFAGDETPFYALPYVTLRGVPALRYQGDSAASFEGELRWEFVPRWSLVGFGGVGQAVADTSDFGGESDLVGAGGVGVRYFIARKFGLHVGLDVARGPEETAVYIQVGSAWR